MQTYGTFFDKENVSDYILTKKEVCGDNNGGTESFRYEATPYGKTILVTLSPVLKNGQCLGCVQSVILKEEIDSVLK
ncbi:MAG: hypothetical protein R6U55_07940 [Desulfovermiculus sp.]